MCSKARTRSAPWRVFRWRLVIRLRRGAAHLATTWQYVKLKSGTSKARLKSGEVRHTPAASKGCSYVTAGYEEILGRSNFSVQLFASYRRPQGTEIRSNFLLPYPQEPPCIHKVLPTVGPINRLLPGCSRYPFGIRFKKSLWSSKAAAP